MNRRKNIDKILVIDIESTCWKDQKEQGEMKSEIIEIGYTIIDLKNNNINKKDSIFIKPKFSKISDFCHSLTGITTDFLNHYAINPQEAFKILYEEFGKNNIIWASYGDYDKIQLERMSKLYNLHYPLGRTHINIKALAALSLKLNEEIDLKQMTELIFNEFEGYNHSGSDDSYNAAKILFHILNKMRAK